MIESFVHLHVHSDYTLSKGGSKVKDLVKRAKGLGMPAMALTDEANMFGALEFSKAAAEAGVQPIVGTKFWFPAEGKAKGCFILLAKDQAGYENLCRLTWAAHRPGEDGKPSEGVLTDLTGCSDGLVMLTGGQQGCLAELVRKGKVAEAEELLSWLRYEFSGNLYIEISRHGDETPEEIAVEEALLDMAFSAPAMECRDHVVREGVPVVATSPVWYAEAGRHDAYEILKAVEGKSRVALQDGAIVPTSGRRYHMRTSEEMRALFSDLPEAFENAVQIARRCAFKVSGRKPILPPFDVGGGRSEADEMRVQARAGLDRRLAHFGIVGEARKPYDERLEYELGIIEQMGFPGYFLIVSDFITWAKSKGIPVGPGRGSGAGSVVAWSLQITDLDPLAFGLLFERFLNPERVSMPDFDIDFCQDRRDEVIQYVRDKYGADYVSMIATFGEIKSKTALKDVGRVMQSDEFGGYGFGELDTLTKLMPMNGAEPKKLADAMEDEQDTQFAEMVRSEEKYRQLLKAAMKIEGLYRTQGSHAAGVIIAGQELQTLVPVGWDDKAKMPVCQFNMKASEAVGLVKFDFLGLKTLSVIRECLEHVERTTGEKIDLSKVPLDDAPTYEMLAEGHSNGVFQFESEGMKRVLRDIRPTRIDDLIAVAALYRPGPMDMIPHYAACKNGKAEPEYPEPVEHTKPFLEETYGIMVYQEQVMQVAQVVAGYSLGGADLLRRAMGKKIPAEMAAQRDMFVKGAIGQGIDAKAANELFDTIAKFADYGFNKSHAAAYALIAYHTAWLKKHYPAQFSAALLTYETNDPSKMAKVKEDMDLFGVPMLPPCIDRSDGRFVPEKLDGGGLGVRFGLTAIKGVSGDLSILKDARRAGPFLDLKDFHARAGAQFNKGQIQKLVEAGAFDRLAKGGNRNSAFSVLSFLAKGGKAKATQDDLFGGTLEVMVPKEIEDVADWGNRIDRQFLAVGFYFAEHPLDVYLPKFRKVKVKRKASLRQWMVDNGYESLKQKRLAGLVEFAERRTSRNGKVHVFAKLSEWRDSFNVLFFNEDQAALERIRTTLMNAKTGRRPVVVVADLALDSGGRDFTIWGREVMDADELLSGERGEITVTIDPSDVILSSDEQKALRETREAEAKGTAGPGSADAAERAARAAAVRRRVETVKEMMAGLEDDGPGSVPVTLCIVRGKGEVPVAAKLPGTYRIDMAAENALKATDGVVSVAEGV